MQQFTLSRTLTAAPDAVYRAWTDPEHLRWFFSDGVGEGERIELDPRIGGAWKLRMVVDDETEYLTGGVYVELVPDSKLVFMWGATDGWPLIVTDPTDNALVTVLISGSSESTTMTLTVALPERISHPHIEQGWGDTIDRVVVALTR